MSSDTYDAEIRRTSFGIPHIKARDYGSLAMGVAYIYAQDNLELLVDAILTVRGERSRFLGGAAENFIGGKRYTNLESDLFFRFYLDHGKISSRFARQPLCEIMAEGYIAGLKLALSNLSDEVLSRPYREALSSSPPIVSDFYLLLVQKGIQASGEAFAGSIIKAVPPFRGQLPVSPHSQNGEASLEQINAGLGSNAFAIGRDMCADTAILSGNTHFPWHGHKRFYEMHLTIPGEIDVMGAALLPFPVINIGFNRDVAWTHTVSPSRVYAIYELKLSRRCSFEYHLDGKTEKLLGREISLDNLNQDGRIESVKHVLYESRFGPIMSIPEMGVRWTNKKAYAFHDSVRWRTNFLEQWLAINKARSVHEIKTALKTHRSVAWLNTVAADRHGDVLYANLSAVPDVSSFKRWSFAPSWHVAALGFKLNIAILNGARSRCALTSAEGLSTKLLPAEAMPTLLRQDYVLNCNDSHWMTNKNDPLTGFSGLIGAERQPQSPRTRMAHQLIEALSQDGRKISISDVKGITLSNRNFIAEMILDQLIAACRQAPIVTMEDGTFVDIVPACDVLAAWNRLDDLEGYGAAFFREFWQRARQIKRLWQRPFNRNAPLSTPSGLNTRNRKALIKVRAAVAQTMRIFEEIGIPLDVGLADVQRYPTPDGLIGIPGGTGDAGVLNQVLFGPLSCFGYEADVVSGSSYTQVVTWKDAQPVAVAILPFSQSSQRHSPYSCDQTKLFARGEWVQLPFSEAEIACELLAEQNLSCKKPD